MFARSADVRSFTIIICSVRACVNCNENREKGNENCRNQYSLWPPFFFNIKGRPVHLPLCPWSPKCPFVKAYFMFVCFFLLWRPAHGPYQERDLRNNTNLTIDKITWLLSICLCHMMTFHLGSSVTCPNGDAAVTQEAADRHSVGHCVRIVWCIWCIWCITRRFKRACLRLSAVLLLFVHEANL